MLSPFLQLWNKGVDIAASIVSTTVSAGIVASVAALTWEWKKKRELTLAAEIDARRRTVERQQQQERYLKYVEDSRARLAEEMRQAKTDFRIQDVWNRYQKWLEANRLDCIPENQDRLDPYRPYYNNFIGMHHANVPITATNLSEVIAATICVPPDIKVLTSEDLASREEQIDT